jgi:hypothetical protein
VDPSVASTEQAYIYTNDNPVYMTDPQGTETVGPPGGGGSPYPQCGSPSTETYNIYEVCIRENEAGIVGTGHANWEDFLMGLGVAAGIVAIGSGIGILAGVEIAGLSVADLGTVSTVASLTAGLTEAPKCATGTGSSQLVACFGLMTSPLSSVLGLSGQVLGFGDDALRAGGLVSLEYGSATLVFHYTVAIADRVNIDGQGSRRHK